MRTTLATLFSVVLLQDFVDSNQRIYGGYSIDVTEAPYMVTIVIFIEQYANGSTKYLECGGTMLRRNLILTAAHCNLDNDKQLYDPRRYSVISGTNQTVPHGDLHHTVKTVFVHPKYRLYRSETYRFHDVGLLELNDDIQLGNRAQLVELAHPNDRPAVGADCIISGYGTNPDHPNNKYLYQVHMNVISAKQCVEELALGTVEQVGKHNICVKAPNKNQCRGDSGGPLHDVSTNRHVGIVSYGHADCTSDTPSIDCRVTDNLDYIEKIIKLATRQHSDAETFRSTDPKTTTTPRTSTQSYAQTNLQKNPQNNPHALITKCL